MWKPTLLCACLLTAGLAGCIADTGEAQRVREIDMWVKQMDWEIHPNVTTTVWAFCAEGDAVEPVHGNKSCSVPGPTIRVQKGDLVRLTFENTHNIDHTVHFHGWHEFGADMNGVNLVDDAMVTEPGETQTIEWTAKPSGSFIYHCHFQTPTHMDMGMYGNFIVEDPHERAKEEGDPDVEKSLVLDEWQIGNATSFSGADPDYNYFTINGKSSPLTEPIVADPGDSVRLHLVNAGYEFRAMHIHGYTPDSWEGVAGPEHAVPTDVREVAPGQTVVLDFTADREGVWLFHDHVVPHVTAAADGDGFGAYPRGMLTFLVVGQDYVDRFDEIAPQLLEVALGDTAGASHDHGEAESTTQESNDSGNVREVAMTDFEYDPKTIRVEPNTTVRWTNEDSVMHTVTADDGSFDSGEVQSGEVYERTFTEPGTYEYHCEPHASQGDDGDWQGMVGKVIVEG